MDEEDSLQVTPFDFIRKCDPANLLTLLQYEHPQTLAVVLSFLEPYKASLVLQNLPYEIQSDVTRRIAVMRRVSPEVLRIVERIVEMKISRFADDLAPLGGIETTVEVLNCVDRSTEKQIIEALEDEDPELAEEIKKRMFVFEDILMLDDRSIQKVMREVDSQELATALLSVDQEVQGKIFRNMSKRAASMLKEDMEYMGPVRLKDVEEAQQKIVSIIRHLEDTGEIVIARAGEDELVSASKEEMKYEYDDLDDVVVESDDLIKKAVATLDEQTLVVALKLCSRAVYRKLTNSMNLWKRCRLMKKIVFTDASLFDVTAAQKNVMSVIMALKNRTKDE